MTILDHVAASLVGEAFTKLDNGETTLCQGFDG
jgi:hypothetical protein